MYVKKFSESFNDLWEALARDIDVEWELLDNGPIPSGPTVAAVVVAGGGEEQEIIRWLDSVDVPPGTPVLAVGADTSRRIAVQIVGRGAQDYFALPDDLEILRNALAAAVSRRSLLRAGKGARSGPKPPAFDQIIGESAALKDILARAERVLRHSTTTVLLIGETGTGKELLAQAIHDGGARRGAPFVAVNCSALPANLIESELFGHEAGAFTDARAAKPGLFEIADGGTLFLDEIGTMPLELQAKLLRALQERQIRRVGGTKTRDVDVRIIAATNDDLRRSVQDGTFRHDLFFRLSVVTLTLPPLRDRGDDVIVLAEDLLIQEAARLGLPVPPIDAELHRALMGYHWPGNVRELKNAIERALLLSPPGELDVKELISPSDLDTRIKGPIPFPAPLDEITTAAVQAMLQLCQNNRSDAARRLGISRQRLRRILEGGDKEIAD